MKSNNRPRVLCVDDDEDSREMLSTLLKCSRIEAKAVATAALALSAIHADRFDLYLLEAWLPDLDGFELCRRMRAFDRQTPILFYSGAAYDSDKKRGIEAGANAYVVKPDVDGLVERIAQFIAPQKALQPPALRSYSRIGRVLSGLRSLGLESDSLRESIRFITSDGTAIAAIETPRSK